MGRTVKQVAEVAGISVRTLHYYDEIGLLRPASKSEAGYRLYSSADLERLQQIMFFRELGFGLGEIRQIIEGPGFDHQEALREHRRLLEAQRERLGRLIEAVDRSLVATKEGNEMSNKQMFEGFDEKQIELYRQEARTRWGGAGSDESDCRTRDYTKADWQALLSESEAITQEMAALLGCEPTDPRALAVAERWWHLIDERFYSMTPEIFRGLGDVYVADKRFTATYEAIKPGLAEFMRAVMHAYCDQLKA